MSNRRGRRLSYQVTSFFSENLIGFELQITTETMDKIKLIDTGTITSKNNSQYNEMGSKAHCLPFEQNASKGIWAGDNPLDYPYPLTLAQIILVVLTSRLLYCFLRPLGQTRYVCNLLVCFCFSPTYRFR